MYIIADGWLAELEVSTAWSVGSYMLCAYIEGEEGKLNTFIEADP
jgi:hypothetical protein